MVFRLSIFSTLLCCISLTGQVDPVFVEVASGFDDPVVIANAGDGSNRLFICEQRGVIRVIDDIASGNVLASPFLDIETLVNDGGERGLLGLVFHPQFPDSPYFFVQYTHNPGGGNRNRISRFTISPDPNLADSGSELVLLDILQPHSNHNGGDIHFGPDGFLYIALGDGGSQQDPDTLAQNPDVLLGKILRIDVHGDDFPADPLLNYSIPVSNPFVGNMTVRDEIWAIGVRNTWRMSFDAMTGDLYLGDVGQSNIEEVNFQPANSPGGVNYGWACKEGTSTPDYTPCLPGPLTDPVFEYDHGDGSSITGGFVYRGSAFPNFFGKYLTVDYNSGNLWVVDPNNGWSSVMFNLSPNHISTFGQSESLELYAANIRSANDKIYRVFDNSACQDTLIIPTITQKYELAEISIQSSAIVPAADTLIFAAADSILLNEGWEVPLSSLFDAYMESCTNHILQARN